jgi:hypothetical protein
MLSRGGSSVVMDSFEHAKRLAGLMLSDVKRQRSEPTGNSGFDPEADIHSARNSA